MRAPFLRLGGLLDNLIGVENERPVPGIGSPHGEPRHSGPFSIVLSWASESFSSGHTVHPAQSVADGSGPVVEQVLETEQLLDDDERESSGLRSGRADPMAL